MNGEGFMRKVGFRREGEMEKKRETILSAGVVMIRRCGPNMGGGDRDGKERGSGGRQVGG